MNGIAKADSCFENLRFIFGLEDGRRGGLDSKKGSLVTLKCIIGGIVGGVLRNPANHDWVVSVEQTCLRGKGTTLCALALACNIGATASRSSLPVDFDPPTSHVREGIRSGNMLWMTRATSRLDTGEYRHDGCMGWAAAIWYIGYESQ